jgi:hypothetical protein
MVVARELMAGGNATGTWMRAQRCTPPCCLRQSSATTTCAPSTALQPCACLPQSAYTMPAARQQRTPQRLPPAAHLSLESSSTRPAFGICVPASLSVCCVWLRVSTVCVSLHSRVLATMPLAATGVWEAPWWNTEPAALCLKPPR